MKEIVVLGDTEIGGGTLTDDFISDNAFYDLVSSYSNKKNTVDLILNGDTFDFLKCPIIKNGITTFPRHITKEISLEKLDLMYKAHPKFFKALEKFVKNKNNRLFFVIGNHDHDLFFKDLQKKIKKIIKSKSNVFFRLKYHYHGVYAEHGQQYDFLNKVNPKRPFLKYFGKNILNINWISFGLVSRFMTLKEEHPFLERIKPYPLLFSHHKAVVKKISWRSFEYFIKSLIYYPLRYFYDPTYSIPSHLIKEFYRRYKNVHWDVDEIISVFKRKRKRFIKKNKILILGHIHKKHIEQEGNWTIIHPDSWRDEYILDANTKILTAKIKRYVHIKVEENNDLHWDLIEVPIKRSQLNFNEVIKNEKNILQLAAKEEGFKLNI